MLRTLAASSLSSSESYVLHPSTKRPFKPKLLNKKRETLLPQKLELELSR